MVSPVSNRMIPDNFNLARAESFVLVRKITLGKGIFRERLDEAEDFLLLCPALRHDCEQFKMQIDGVARHELNFGSNVSRIHRA